MTNPTHPVPEHYAHLGLPSAPENITDAAADLWFEHLAILAEQDKELEPWENAIFVEALRHLSLADRLETELAALDTLMVPGSRGNTRVSPIVDTLDKVRKSTALLLAKVSAAPTDRAAAQRNNAAARWTR